MSRQQAVEPNKDAPGDDLPAGPDDNTTQEQIPIIMGMAYFTDGITDAVKNFLHQEEIFSTLSRENIRYLMRMIAKINTSLNNLRNMLVDCY